MLRGLILLSILAALVVLAPSAPAVAKGDSTTTETFRISGGDLPHPVVISRPEYLMAASAQGSWYTRDAGLSEPPVSQVRYKLDVVDAHSDAVPPYVSYQYVPGPPARVTAADGNGWAEPIPEIADLLDRYILLGSRRLLPERPTIAEALRASSDALGVKVSAGGTALAPDAALRVASLLGEATPVIFGVRGTLIGSRNLHAVKLVIRFGEMGLHVTYVPPGPIAPYGLLLNDRSVGNWEYIALLDPPGYAQWAYTIPPQFDELMAGLGFTGASEGAIIENRVVPLDQARLTSGVDHYEVWLADGPRVTVRPPDGDAEASPCPTVAACTPVEPFTGPSMDVEMWPTGIDPFPEAVQPARYVYYPHDASGSALGVLVMTQQQAYANAFGGGTEPPVYASPALDAALKAQLARLTNGSERSSRAHLAKSLGVGVPAVLLGVLAIAYVSWDAERQRRRSGAE